MSRIFNMSCLYAYTQEPWSALLTTREVMDGMPYTVTAAAVCVDTGVVTAVAWRIADNTETRKCINTLAVVKLVPDANGDYQIASTQVWTVS